MLQLTPKLREFSDGETTIALTSLATDEEVDSLFFCVIFFYFKHFRLQQSWRETPDMKLIWKCTKHRERMYNCVFTMTIKNKDLRCENREKNSKREQNTFNGFVFHCISPTMCTLGRCFCGAPLMLCIWMRCRWSQKHSCITVLPAGIPKIQHTHFQHICVMLVLIFSCLPLHICCCTLT